MAGRSCARSPVLGDKNAASSPRFLHAAWRQAYSPDFFISLRSRQAYALKHQFEPQKHVCNCLCCQASRLGNLIDWASEIEPHTLCQVTAVQVTVFDPLLSQAQQFLAEHERVLVVAASTLIMSLSHTALRPVLPIFAKVCLYVWHRCMFRTVTKGICVGTWH